MNQTIEPIEFLRETYKKRRDRNPTYSLRAFAKSLDISPARLSQMLNRRRPITSNQLEKIADALALDPETKSRLAAKSPGPRLDKLPRAKAFEAIDLEVFKFISDWQHSALICLLTTQGAKSEVRWLAKRLGVSTIEIRGTIERLVRLGMIGRRGKRLVPTAGNFATPSGIPSAALRSLHKQMIDKASDALESQSTEQRDITSMTMGIDKSRLPEAKILIQEFRRQLCAYLEGGTPSEVYALNVQLFQLSK